MKKGYKKGECDSCGSDDMPVIETEHIFAHHARMEDGKMTGHEPQKVNVCEICYTTHASKPFFYTNNSMEPRDVLTVIAQVGNLIRKDIQRLGTRLTTKESSPLNQTGEQTPTVS